MGMFVKAIAGILFIGVVGAGVLAYAATTGATRQCPAAQPTAMTAKQIGDALESGGSVRITNGDATTVGRSYLGNAVADLRVCFDPAAGHASGTLAAGPVKVPFYVTARSVDLSGGSPRINDLDFELGSVPSAVANAAKSTITGLINDNLATIRLTKRYSYQFGDGAVTVRSN